ncbi:hypothetical protein EG68_05698 [Paragonimus skrjabini miyazakii]|uniref:Uncharacterized protein n=1 Tax=Paragonimus skrjabini miyazakii TaxID=59628 RepID=A0A8S9YPS2_9TREM|nr:hypothetical protein EG68_05698 [Paragonimus skrjabini miyazakii]
MFRRLTTFKSLISEAPLQKLGFLCLLRKHPILLACLSSGLVYRGYVALLQHHVLRIPQNSLHHVNQLFGGYAFYSDGGAAKGQPDNTARMERMIALRQAIENELPQFFERSLFDLPSGLFDPGTIVSVERKDGSVHVFRSRSWANSTLVMARAYYMMRSSFRRLELVNILSDSESWELEVSFRIVLFPSPSLRDSRLPADMLWKKLESRAKWHEFRAKFFISETGDISEVRLTKFLPPQRPPNVFQNLKQLAFVKRLNPALPGTRRLPTPTPFVFEANDLRKPLERDRPSYPVPTQPLPDKRVPMFISNTLSYPMPFNIMTVVNDLRTASSVPSPVLTSTLFFVHSQVLESTDVRHTDILPLTFIPSGYLWDFTRLAPYQTNSLFSLLPPLARKSGKSQNEMSVLKYHPVETGTNGSCFPAHSSTCLVPKIIRGLSQTSLICKLSPSSERLCLSW